MLAYYLALAFRSLKRNIALTILMIVAIAFGVGASMTTLTVMHVLAQDPIPQKSSHLFYVQLDPGKLENFKEGEEPNDQMTRLDSQNLLAAKRADRQAMMTSGSAAIESDRPGIDPFRVDTRFTTTDFFSLFNVPFVAGTGWTAEDDTKAARVVVIARPLAEKVFGTTNVVGRELRVGGSQARIVGVIDDWRPTPHFYDLYSAGYGKAEELFIPFSTALELKLDRGGTMNCWDSSPDPLAVGAPCEWIQFWVELDSSEKVAKYREYLVHYSEEQKQAGTYQRPPNVRLRNVMQLLAYKKVVPDDARLQMWIALGFLLVCLINCVGLLLTKFLRRSSEIGVRRALGASKQSIFIQLLVESGIIGVIGGIAGLGLAWLGLWAVRHQPADYADLAQLDVPMLFATFGVAVVASLLAGLFPAWRGCQITPAIQLKSH